jgi:hypothetical protein
MPIFNTVVHTSSKYKYEIEAKDIEEAQEKAEERCVEENCPDVVDDVEAELSDNQYTDQQELQDRERE